MAQESMTIEQVKEAKIDLESAITELIVDYEEKTGVAVTWLNIQRKREYEDVPEPVSSTRGPIQTVSAEIDLDLID